MAAGVLAASEVIESLGRTVPDSIDRAKAEREHRRSARFQEYLWRLYRAPLLLDQLASASTTVCRCESVSLGEIEGALDAGVTTAGALKRMTRAGMGKCQARYCGPIVTDLVARRSGVAIGEYSGLWPQAPFKPTDIATVAAPQPGLDTTRSGSPLEP
jgi:bacterioferritin-associated ferredoxin